MINVKHCIRTCSACPSQWTVITDVGECYYIRYRFGTLTVRRMPLNLLVKPLLEISHGTEWQGYLSTQDMMSLTMKIFDWSGACHCGKAVCLSSWRKVDDLF